MADIVWSDVTDLDASLSSVSVAAQALYLENANAHFCATTMGGEESANLKLARIYHAAHHAVVAGYAAEGTAGPVTEYSLGDERTKYGGATQAVDLASSDPLNASAWGRLLNQLVRSTPLARLPVLL